MSPFFKNTMTAIGAGSALLIAGSFSAQADEFPFLNQAHQGTLNERHTVDALYWPVPGRNGSAMAAIIEYPDQATVYLVDPSDTASTYVMTPLQIDKDGYLGVASNNPSLVMNILDSTKGAYTLTNAQPSNTHLFQSKVVLTRDYFNSVQFPTRTESQSSNTYGFQGVLKFKGQNSKFSISLLQPGTYKALKVKEGELYIGEPEKSALDPSQQATLQIQVSTGNPGNYVIRERWSRLFSLNAIQRKGTGTETDPFSSFFALFVEKGKKQFLLMVSSNDPRDTRIFRRK